MQAESSKVVIAKGKNKKMDPDVEGSSISEAKRIKLDTKSKVQESKLASIWSKITDTNVGKWDYEEFQARMTVKDPSVLARRLIDLGLAHVTIFPSAV